MAQFAPTPSISGSWGKWAHKQSQHPVLQISAKCRTWSMRLKSRFPPKAHLEPGLDLTQMGCGTCTFPPVSRAPRPGPSSQWMLPYQQTRGTGKGCLTSALQLGITPIHLSLGSAPICSIVPCLFLHPMPDICVIAYICRRGKEAGPLLQRHPWSMLQPPQKTELA